MLICRHVTTYLACGVLAYGCKSRDPDASLKSESIRAVEQETLAVLKELEDLQQHAEQYFVPQYDRPYNEGAVVRADEVRSTHHVWKVTKLSRLIRAEQAFDAVLEKYDEIGLLPYDRLQKLRLQAWREIEASAKILDARTKRSNWFTRAVMDPFDASKTIKRRNVFSSVWDYCQEVVGESKRDFATLKEAIQRSGTFDSDELNYESLGFFFVKDEYRELLWYLSGQPEERVPMIELLGETPPSKLRVVFWGFFGQEVKDENKPLCRSSHKPPKNYRGGEFWCPILPPKVEWSSGIHLEERNSLEALFPTYSVRAIENLDEMHAYLAGRGFIAGKATASDGVCPIILDTLDHLRLEHGPDAYPFVKRYRTSQPSRGGKKFSVAELKENDKKNHSLKYLGSTRVSMKPTFMRQLQARIDVLKAVVEAVRSSSASTEADGDQRQRFLAVMDLVSDSSLSLEEKERKIEDSLYEVMRSRAKLDDVDAGSTAGWGGHLSNHAKAWYEALSRRSGSYAELNQYDMDRTYRLLRAKLFQLTVERYRVELGQDRITSLENKMFRPAEMYWWRDMRDNGRLAAEALRTIAAIRDGK